MFAVDADVSFPRLPSLFFLPLAERRSDVDIQTDIQTDHCLKGPLN